ncbi:Protein TIC110, chloroplastic, partial [Mucuna pruriens]
MTFQKERTDIYKTCFSVYQICSAKSTWWILGLSGIEIVEVHRSLAEHAFMQQAEVVLADRQLTKARMEQLNNLPKQVDLPQEYSQEIIKSITTTKIVGLFLGSQLWGQKSNTLKFVRSLFIRGEGVRLGDPEKVDFHSQKREECQNHDIVRILI